MTKKQTNYPYIDSLLIEALKDTFPNQLPETEITPFQLGYLIGQQTVIKKLEFEMQEQEEDA